MRTKILDVFHKFKNGEITIEQADKDLLNLYSFNQTYIEEVADNRFPSFPEDGQGGTCWDTCANEKQDALMQGVSWVIEYNDR